jgi:hypothetical protein
VVLALAHRSGCLVALKRATLTPLALIHRSAWKGNSAKSGCRILHSPGPMGELEGLTTSYA